MYNKSRVNFFNKDYNYRRYNDVRYLEEFYNEVLRKEIPPVRRHLNFADIDFSERFKLFKKYENKYKFQKEVVSEFLADNRFEEYELLNNCLNLLHQLGREIDHIKNIEIDNSNPYNSLKSFLLDFYRKFSINILSFLKNYNSIESLTDYTFESANHIFKNKKTNEWFLKSLEDRFDIKNSKTRGIGAFLKALLLNEDVSEHIFIGKIKQKEIIEYLNGYYKNPIFKNTSKLSDPSKYSKEVKNLIKQYLDVEKGIVYFYSNNK